ncbi:SubName: Full=Uncharacterized protein {ECO:0000313/EMBL:CCA73933.1} [Serendipita indica DSM 11827]|nr:SubName: Full=Uncharacterized protein {ECO:0000313/EMBL:CCA73933.1} [Serendipita indica DSM 11827]
MVKPIVFAGLMTTFVYGATAQTAKEWGQCGGIGYVGPTACPTGWICTPTASPFFSTCQKAATTAAPSSTSSTSSVISTSKRVTSTSTKFASTSTRIGATSTSVTSSSSIATAPDAVEPGGLALLYVLQDGRALPQPLHLSGTACNGPRLRYQQLPASRVQFLSLLPGSGASAVESIGRALQCVLQAGFARPQALHISSNACNGPLRRH